MQKTTGLSLNVKYQAVHVPTGNYPVHDVIILHQMQLQLPLKGSRHVSQMHCKTCRLGPTLHEPVVVELSAVAVWLQC
jgi:hypothetical protein